jgi:hypothetical protein
MTSDAGRLYEFAFRGLVTEESLDRAGRANPRLQQFSEAVVARTLSLDLLEDEHVISARKMAAVYTAVAALENSVRKLISTRLLEETGADWWVGGVSDKIRSRAEARQAQEERTRYHSRRGGDHLNYTDLKDLGSIIRQNWATFEPYFPSVEWVESIFNVVEQSRNVIMHSGNLDDEDVERLGIYIRDWVKQVGA